MWNEINNSDELKVFEDYFDKFHDSCIKEMTYLSGSYVLEDLSMHPINDKRILRAIFQRQSLKLPVIEIEFSGLIQMNLCPIVEAYSSEITEATLEITEQGIVWYDCEPLSNDELKKYHGTKIVAAKMKWRALDENLGKEEIYRQKTGNGSLS